VSAIDDLNARIADCRQAENDLAYSAARDPNAAAIQRQIADRREVLEQERAARSDMADSAASYWQCDQQPDEASQAQCRRYWSGRYHAARGRLQLLQAQHPQLYGSNPDVEKTVGDPCQKCIRDAVDKYRCVPITSVEIVSLAYVSEHKVLRDRVTDWTFAGALFADPEWTRTREHPITHTKYRFPLVQLELVAEPPNACPQKGTLVGELGGRIMYHRKMSLRAGTNLVDLVTPTHRFANGSWSLQGGPDVYLVLSDRVTRGDLRLNWSFYGEQLFSAGTTDNEVYQIFDTPVEAGAVEDGPTLKRMRTAVSLVESANSNDPFEIIRHIMSQLGPYFLSVDHLRHYLAKYTPAQRNAIIAAVTAHGTEQNGFPRWFNSTHGAWPIAESMAYPGECQAICRFLIGVFHQVGSDADIALVYAKANFQQPRIAIVDQVGAPPTGPKPGRQYAMMAGVPTVGTVYWNDDISHQGWWNNFEAFVRYRKSGSEEYYFGGGLGGHYKKVTDAASRAKLVTETFAGMAETEWASKDVPSVNGTTRKVYGRKVTAFHSYK
jgi:hypothetical protein